MPKKKNDKPVTPFKGYADIDTFLANAKILFGLSGANAEGFKAYMHGKHYQYDERDFIPYLEEYLGKKLDI